MKTVNVVTLILVIFGLFCIVQPSFSQGPDLAALDIAAIKSIQLNSDDSNFYSQIVVILENSSDKDIKFKNANFSIVFKDQGQTIPFGNSPVGELIIPAKGGEGSAGGQAEFSLTLTIGPEDDNTVGTLLKLFNIVGNPSHSLLMVMEGTGEVGHKVEKGWIYQTGIRAELEFTPSIQREILFE